MSVLAVAITLGANLAAQCSGPACPDPCTECAFQPVSGENQALPELRALFTSIAERDLGQGVSIQQLGAERSELHRRRV